MSKKLAISLTLFSALISTSFITKTANADELTIPKSADTVLADTNDHIKYIDEEGVTLTGADGSQLEAPLIVDSQIISKHGDEIESVTEYTTDLSESTVIEEEDNFLKLSLGYIFGLKVSAQDFEYATSRWDSTGSVEISTKVYWTKSGIDAKVTKTSGIYKIHDNQVAVRSSSLRVYSNGLLDNQETSFNLGTASSWSRSVNHQYVKSNNLSSGGAVYSVNLIHGSSSWAVSLANQAWA
ncbi:hypothetical protein RyT2_22770 [Pseudolactococcus yaeyamensis]